MEEQKQVPMGPIFLLMLVLFMTCAVCVVTGIWLSGGASGRTVLFYPQTANAEAEGTSGGEMSEAAYVSEADKLVKSYKASYDSYTLMTYQAGGEDSALLSNTWKAQVVGNIGLWNKQYDSVNALNPPESMKEVQAELKSAAQHFKHSGDLLKGALNTLINYDSESVTKASEELKQGSEELQKVSTLLQAWQDAHK